MERNPAVQTAEEAVAWAKRPSMVNPAVTNYDALKLDVQRSLAWRIHPQYVEALDSQAGTAWQQIMFADVTGRRPEARSWRHAKGAVAR